LVILTHRMYLRLKF